MKKLLVAGLFALLGAWPSLAQTPPTAPASAYQPPAATAPVPLAVSGTTARVALTATPGIWPAVTVINDTSAAVYCNLGSSSVTASTSVYQLYVPAGGRWTTFDGTSTNVACITGGGTGTVHITQSNGTPQLSFLNGSGGTPGGAAGGDLSGTYPNPTVATYSGGTTFGTAAHVNTGTSGATIPLNSTANTFSAAQTVNLNSVSVVAPDTGTSFQVSGVDATASIIENDAFGAAPSVIERRADGTNASKTAVQSADVLANFGARPYDGSAYPTTSTGNVQILALENFTTAHHGTGVGFNCTAITTLTTATCGSFSATGLNLPTGETYQINGAQIASANLSDTANIALLNAANTFTNNQVVSAHSFGLSGNITGAAIFGTSGIRYKNVAATLSDTTSSGTIATNYDSAFGGNTLTATNATTITNNYGTYFTAPVCSTNVTCTANWALGADSLKVGNSVIIDNSGNFTASNNAQIGAGSLLGWSARSEMSSPADGVVRFINNAQSGFTGLKLGGTTSSFPYVKVNGAAIDLRVADDTAYTGINALSFTVQGNGSVSSGRLVTNNQNEGVVGGASPSGAKFSIVAQTNIDGSTAGTYALWYNGLIDTATLQASNAVTYTNAYGLYIKAPVAGTNVVQTNAYALGADSLAVTGAVVNLTALAQSTAADVLCYAVSTGRVTYEPTGTTCTVSALRFKRNIVSQSDDRDFSIIMGMRPVSFRYKPGIDDGGAETHYGFIAEEVQKVAPELVAWEPDGKQLHGVKYAELSPYIVGAIQKQQAEITALKSENARLRAANDNFDHRLAALERPKRKVASR